MLKWALSCVLSITLLSIASSGEDFPFSDTRPLMALSSELQDRYGLMVTYEDAPTDPVTETNSQIHPNGVTFFFPAWKPITFHVQSDLPTRPDLTAPLNGTIDANDSLGAIKQLIGQYNESGNPGQFAAVQDGDYIHIQQVKRSVGGKLQPFEPFSDTVVTWPWKPASCEQILQQLNGALERQHKVDIAEGVVPVGTLLTHSCNIEGTPLTVRHVLEAVLDGLNADKYTGRKRCSYSWELVYDPNWNKYFLSIRLVRQYAVQTTTDASRQNTVPGVVAPSQKAGRLGTSTGPKRQD